MDNGADCRLIVNEDSAQQHSIKLKEKLESLGILISLNDAQEHYAQIMGFNNYKELKDSLSPPHLPSDLIISMENFDDFMQNTKDYSYFHFSSNQEVWADRVNFKKITTNKVDSDLMHFIAMNAYGSAEILERLKNEQQISFMSQFNDPKLNFLVNINTDPLRELIITFKKRLKVMPKLQEVIKSNRFLNEITSLRPGVNFISGMISSGKSVLLASMTEHYQKFGLKITSFETVSEYKFSGVKQIDISKISLSSGLKQHMTNDIFLLPTMDVCEMQSTGLFNMSSKIFFSTLHTKNVAQAMTKLIAPLKENKKRSTLIDLVSHLRMMIGCRRFAALNEHCYLYEIFKMDSATIDDLLDSDEISYKKLEQKIQEKINNDGLSFYDYATELEKTGSISKELLQTIKKDLRII